MLHFLITLFTAVEQLCKLKHDFNNFTFTVESDDTDCCRVHTVYMLNIKLKFLRYCLLNN